MKTAQKVISKGKMTPMRGGGSSGEHSGPTGSCRSYPAGSAPSMKADFNPQKVKATTWAVGGC